MQLEPIAITAEVFQVARLRSNRTDYLASLERLLALNADILCEGHYGIFRSKPVVARFIHSCLNAALGP